MSDTRARLVEALRESIAPWMTGFCEGAEVDVDADGLLLSVDDLSEEIADELLSLPGVIIVETPVAQTTNPKAWDGKEPWPGDNVLKTLKAWRD